MKKTVRILSFILSLATLLSVFSVFSFAATPREGVKAAATDENMNIIYNRTFNEGWGINNGLGNSPKENNFFIDEEQDALYNYNYFVRFEALNKSDGFVTLDFGDMATTTGGVVAEFDVKIDDYSDFGTILYASTTISSVKDLVTNEYSSGTGVRYDLLGIEDNQLVLMPRGYGGQEKINIGNYGSEWVHFAYVFDCDREPNVLRIYVNGEFKAQYTMQTNGYKNVTEIIDGVPTTVRHDTQVLGQGIRYFRFGFPGETPGKIGMSWCLDNLRLYTGVKQPYGDEYFIKENGDPVESVKVDTAAEKPIAIKTNTGEKTKAQYLAESLCMKIGVDYGYYGISSHSVRSRNPILTADDGTVFGAPVRDEDGNVLVPLELLADYMGSSVYVHPDGQSYDISVDGGAAYIAVGRDTATVNGKLIDLTTSPIFVNREINGKKYSYIGICMDDIENLFPGWYLTYDDMGLIIVGGADELISRKEGLDQMLDLMKKFIFDYAEDDDLYEITKANTNNFTHPYMYVDGVEDLNVFKEIYDTGATTDNAYIESVYEYVNGTVREARNFIRNYAIVSDGAGGEIEANASGKSVNYISIAEDRVDTSSDKYNFVRIDLTSDTIAGNPNINKTRYTDPDNYGYDSGGRSGDVTNVPSMLQKLAIAYYATQKYDEASDTYSASEAGKIYALAAYEIALNFTTWVHWGPGHFLNTASAMGLMGTAFDWFYNIWLENGITEEQLNALAKGIYDKGIYQAYNLTINNACDYPSPVLGNVVSSYATADGNWNPVCTGGTVEAVLGVMGALSGDALEKSIKVATSNLKTLTIYGLDNYAPDGSYIESPSYWAYGTNALFDLIWVLDSAAGNDFGLMDTWGLDKTCYYALQSESSDYKEWNYHDGGTFAGTQDTSRFGFVGGFLGDEDLIAIRIYQLQTGGKSASLYDVLTYNPSLEGKKIELSLDYYMQGIDGFVSRSSWEKGAMYTGLMGGANNCAHGQVDSGNFIYHNGGVIWLCDIGSEEYTVSGYFASDRNKYYRASSEGHNTIVLTSDQDVIPYGQLSTGAGVMTDFYANEHGSFGVVDNTSVYGDNMLYARRGLLVTNDRQTVVVQDEIETAGSFLNLYWTAHVKQYKHYSETYGSDHEITIELSPDGRTAYLIEKKTNQCVRLSIVSRMSGLKFKLSDCYTPLLDATFNTPYGSGTNEESREQYTRLYIESMTAVFELAVVIEMLELDENGKPVDKEVGYTYSHIRDWEPTAAQDGDNGDSTGPVVGESTGAADLSGLTQSDIARYVTEMNNMINKGTALTSDFNTFYNNVAKVMYGLLVKFNPDRINVWSSTLEAYNNYEENILPYYKVYADPLVECSRSVKTLVDMLAGVDARDVIEEPEVDE